MVTVRQLLQHLRAAAGAAAPGVDDELPLGIAWVRGLSREQPLVIQLESAADHLPATWQPAKRRVLDQRIEAPRRRPEGDRRVHAAGRGLDQPAADESDGGNRGH